MTYCIGLTVRKWFLRSPLTCCVVQHSVRFLSCSMHWINWELYHSDKPAYGTLGFLWCILSSFSWVPPSAYNGLAFRTSLLASAFQTSIFQPERAEDVKPSCAVQGMCVYCSTFGGRLHGFIFSCIKKWFKNLNEL